MMFMKMGEIWAGLGSTIGSIMFIYAIFQQYCPPRLRDHIHNYTQRVLNFFNPYIQVSFHEYTGERFRRNAVYTAIETYLSRDSSQLAKRLKADIVDNSKTFVFVMDDYEEITDHYQGIKLKWASRKSHSTAQKFSFYSTDADDKRYFMLTFHRKDRKLVIESYLKHVQEEGKKIGKQNRQRKLYTNNKSERWNGYRRTMWSYMIFEHPSTFQTLAMDPNEKKKIMDDLVAFSQGKAYYAKVGKAWKRGYLLYGPPGTGKSSMVAAMANFLEYDVYDLELTSVKDNSELKKLLIEISEKSIIVIEDIDCSLDLTGQRKKEKKEEDNGKEEDLIAKKATKVEENSSDSKVTLSGLLNFIDGLWSACGGERLIIFTTNYKEQLDRALIRRGRMDKHIELSYCCFEGFKVLAKNYLNIDTHELFQAIRSLLEETQMTPADVAENLMPKAVDWEVESCLQNLIEALMKQKEEATRLKAKEEKQEMVSNLPVSKKEEAKKTEESTHGLLENGN